MTTAEDFKQRGNAHFRNQEYQQAIDSYTQAIIHDQSVASYFTNRAICYYKLDKPDEANQDCQRALEIDPNNMKAHFYSGLAEGKNGRVEKSESHLKRAYDLALQESSPSAIQICQELLNIRKKKFAHKERQLLKAKGPLLAEIIDLFEAKKRSELLEAEQATMSPEDLRLDQQYIEESYAQKINQIKQLLARADPDSFSSPTEVPEYLLDPISFNLFVDPVISKSGQSFERSWILQHLKTHNQDPFTRQLLRKEDLIPNIQLKAAAEAYMEKEGEF